MRVRIAGAWRDVTSGRVRIGGAWKEIVGARCFVGGVWKDIEGFVSPLSVTVSPDTVNGSRFGSGVTTTTSATATPSGGRAPYTYAWTFLSGDSGFTATAPTAATTAFQATLAAGEDRSSNWRVTVTDALGATDTADVSAAVSSF